MAAAALWGFSALLALHERRRTPHLNRYPPADGGPTVSVIIPARNEEHAIGATIAALRGQGYSDLELLVVDDCSTDRTARRARAATEGDRRVRLISGTQPPSGWVGKNWAAWQGYRASRGGLLLFIDADVRLAPDCVGRTVSWIAARRRGLTLLPRIEVGGCAEAVVLPAAVALIATLLAPGPLVRSPRVPVAMAAGGFIALPRADYARVGGHRAIAGRMVDDISLARRLKAAGCPLELVDGADHARLRMYSGAGELWRGWRKNASFGAADPQRAMVAGGLVALLAAAPPLAALRGAGHARALGWLGWLAQAGAARALGRVVAAPRWAAPLFPLGTLVVAAAIWVGAIDRLSGRGPIWRGRRYPAARPISGPATAGRGPR